MRKIAKLDRSTLRGIAALKKDRQEAALLLADIKLAGGDLEKVVRDQQSVLRGVALIDYVLDRSYALRYQDPKQMVDLAEVGRTLAENLSLRRYGRKVRADLCAKAWIELANAYRVADDFKASEIAFGHAVAWAKEGTGETGLAVHLAWRLSALLREQRQFQEAGLLLDKIIRYHIEEGNHEQSATVLLSRALVYEESNEPESAISATLKALELMSPLSPLRLLAFNSLTDNLVGAGLFQPARALLNWTRRLYRRSGKLNQFRLIWLEGRIAFGLGEYGQAEAKFNTARLAFRRSGKHYDEARVGLDLALLLVRQERRRETAWLIDDMLRTFLSLKIAREVLASLILLRKSCEAKRSVEALCGQIETISVTLVELQRERPRQTRQA